jgi:hypothetical protein
VEKAQPRAAIKTNHSSKIGKRSTYIPPVKIEVVVRTGQKRVGLTNNAMKRKRPVRTNGTIA